MIKDYYSILGVSYESPREVIKRVYREIAFNNHPDRFPGDNIREERFKEAAEAYSVLENEETRKEYDFLWEQYFSEKEPLKDDFHAQHNQYKPRPKEKDSQDINIQDIIREIFEERAEQDNPGVSFDAEDHHSSQYEDQNFSSYNFDPNNLWGSEENPFKYTAQEPTLNEEVIRSLNGKAVDLGLENDETVKSILNLLNEYSNQQDIFNCFYSELNSYLNKCDRIRDDSLIYVRDIVEKAESFGKLQNPTVISALETIANDLYDQETNSLIYDVAMSEIYGKPPPYEKFEEYMKAGSSPEESSSYNERPDVEGAFARPINYDTHSPRTTDGGFYGPKKESLYDKVRSFFSYRRDEQ